MPRQSLQTVPKHWSSNLDLFHVSKESSFIPVTWKNRRLSTNNLSVLKQFYFAQFIMRQILYRTATETLVLKSTQASYTILG